MSFNEAYIEGVKAFNRGDPRPNNDAVRREHGKEIADGFSAGFHAAYSMDKDRQTLINNKGKS